MGPWAIASCDLSNQSCKLLLVIYAGQKVRIEPVASAPGIRLQCRSFKPEASDSDVGRSEPKLPCLDALIECLIHLLIGARARMMEVDDVVGRIGIVALANQVGS